MGSERLHFPSLAARWGISVWELEGRFRNGWCPMLRRFEDVDGARWVPLEDVEAMERFQAEFEERALRRLGVLP